MQKKENRLLDINSKVGNVAHINTQLGIVKPKNPVIVTQSGPSELMQVPSKLHQISCPPVDKKIKNLIEKNKFGLFDEITIDKVYKFNRLGGNDLLVFIAILTRASKLKSNIAVFNSYREIATLTGLNQKSIQPSLHRLCNPIWFGVNDSTNPGGIRWKQQTLIRTTSKEYEQIKPNKNHDGKIGEPGERYTYIINDNTFVNSSSFTLLDIDILSKYKTFIKSNEQHDKAILFFWHYVYSITSRPKDILKKFKIEDLRNIIFYNEYYNRNQYIEKLITFLNALKSINYLNDFTISDDKKILYVWYPMSLGNNTNV